MNLKLILSFIVSLLDEVVIIAFVIWVLPRLGIKIPTPWLIVIFVAIAIYAVFSFRIFQWIFIKKPLAGLSSMVGMKGKATTPLTPRGVVKIGGELWQAEAESGNIDAGTPVIVDRQEGLKLFVRAITNEKPPH